MPAINVARSDTFEQQRLKINEIGANLFQISSGGTDLSTGNLRLGDGTKNAPSLAFTSDATLGIFKAGLGTFGFVSASKKIFDASLSNIVSFKDFIVRKQSLNQGGLSITSNGSGYDGGQYSDIPLIGGSGDSATVTVDVAGFQGTVLNTGTRYVPGNYASILLVGGTGTGAQATFIVDPLNGDITDAGSAYVPGSYVDVPLQGGSGSGAKATFNITGTATISGNITNGGSGGTDNSYPFVQLHNTPVQTFVVTSIANPNAGQPGEPNAIYVIDGVTQPTLNVVPGNTYVFDMSDSSLQGSNPGDPTSEHRIGFQAADGGALSSQLYVFNTRGNAGQAGSFADLIIKPEAPTGVQIRYDCANHPNMGPAGGNINVNAGAQGNFGTSAYADLTISGGAITSLTFVDEGTGYRAGDTLYVKSSDVGGNSGFLYTINNVVFTGTVNSVDVTVQGVDYNLNDVLTINDSDVGGGGGSGFQFTVNTDPGRVSDLTFDAYGTGYVATDVLELPKAVTNISSYAPGQTATQASTATAGNPVLIIADTSDLEVGMYCFTSGGDVGALDNTAVIQSIDSGTQITMNTGATVSGAINVYFVSQDLNNITVASTAGIAIGDTIEKVSGTGVLADNTTVGDVLDATTIQLSSQPISPGPIVVNFVPPFGDPITDFQYRVDTLGVVESVTLADGGNGYAVDDILSIQAELLTQPNIFTVLSRAVQEITFTQTIADSVLGIGDSIKVRDGAVSNVSIVTAPTITPTITGPLSGTTTSGNTTITGLSSTTGISVGDFVQEVSTSGNIDPLAKIASITNSTTVVMDLPALASNTIDLNFTSDEAGTYTGVAVTGGTGTGLTLDIERSSQGDILTIQVNNPGGEYTQSDAITVAGTLIGGSSPTHDLSLTADSVSFSNDLEIVERITAGGNISSVTVLTGGATVADGDSMVKVGTTTPIYTVDVAGSSDSRFYIDLADGNGSQKTPNITMYVGSTYRFDLSDASNSAHQFSLSTFPDGINPPSLLENISSTLDVNSKVITVADTTGIVVGMVVTATAGVGQVASNTLVESVDSLTQITLTELPDVSGAVTLQFAGLEYTDGVTKDQGVLDILVTSNTPSLYYYCGIGGIGHQNEGGPDGAEAVITMDPNNPKVFGSGFEIRVSDITSTDQATFNVADGEVSAQVFNATSASITSITATSLTLSTILASSSIEVPQVISQSGLTLQGTSINLNSDTTCGPLSITNATGALATSGEIKTFGQLNINDTLFINNNTVTSQANTSIVFQPAVNQVVTIDSTTAIAVPVGDTAQRPLTAVSGQIRFNTDSNQYEGYSSTASAWSSLGGVRDLDGNTYILAEQTIGANDNTLWFINDNINTVKFTPTRLEFRSNKYISSSNTSAPAYLDWTANAPVSVGDYLKYKNNLYEVTTAGTTGTSGSEPSHTSGAQPNGSAVLTFWGLGVAPLTFEDIEEIRIGPTQDTPVSINQDLRLANNTISTDISDLILQPNAGQKIVCNADSTFVVPVGTDLTRGAPQAGSIRFNTTSSQFEGYDDNNNWGSLGGVKDVDQNTYIIPETTPGANENILYFYNDGTNTVQLTATAMDFFSVDTIRSQTSGEFEITANLMTFNGAETTLDNTDTTKTFLHTSKQYFDLGLSAGVTVDPVLRLDDQGDVYFNTGFGTGTFTGVKVFDGDLKEFELADVRILTEKVTLTKGTVNNGGSNIYDVGTNNGAKTVVVAEDSVTGSREFFEFGIIDNNVDVFHTEYGNIRTGDQLIDVSFELTGTNFVRLNFTIGSTVPIGNNVVVTIVSNVTKG